MFQILTLENQLVEFELEKNKFARNHDISAEQARQLNANRIKIQEDFASLKKKSQDQEKELKSQVCCKMIKTNYMKNFFFGDKTNCESSPFYYVLNLFLSIIILYMLYKNIKVDIRVLVNTKKLKT